MVLAYDKVGGPANITLMSDAIDARQKIAKLVGYANWGDYQTDGRMARTSKTVLDMFNGLKTQIKPRFDADMQQMLEAKKADVAGATKLESWDTAYYATKIKARDFSYDEEAMKEYFPLDVVLQGLFGICGDLFGIRIEEVKDAVVWDQAVKLYAVRDWESLRILGYIYFDPYPRAGKYDWFCVGALLSGRQLGGGAHQKPVAIFIGNFVPRQNDQIPLLTLFDVETVFHEFGHALHVVLTRVPYASLSGYNVPWDYAELPSQLLQFFARDRRILSRVSGHHLDRSKKIPEDMLDKIDANNSFNLGVYYLSQIWMGLLDMTFHTSEINLDPTATSNAIYHDLLGMDLPAGDLFPANFSHLMSGYDAGYYGYLWSEVYAWDLLAEFQKTNFSDAEVGKRYRQAILERGAIRDPPGPGHRFSGPQSQQQRLQQAFGNSMKMSSRIIPEMPGAAVLVP